MTGNLFESTLTSLLGQEASDQLFTLLEIHPSLTAKSDNLSRVQLAQLLNMILFHQLIDYVPEAKQYSLEQMEQGRKIVFDHGALRTVAIEMAKLPQGKLAFSRIFEPLGYEMAGEYPLEKLRMCGFVYTHKDLPEHIAQYFVSELYPERFSPGFQKMVQDLVYDSVDPLTQECQDLLEKLAEQGFLSREEGAELLKELPGCFARQHGIPSLEQYKTFAKESAEMAWIATEGNVFNHATDRVANLDDQENKEKQKGRAMKPKIEEGMNANIRQTAYRASVVTREFVTAEGIISKQVPGSFFEFIQRGELTDPESGKAVMDLRFDSRNAQGIFKMTR